MFNTNKIVIPIYLTILLIKKLIIFFFRDDLHNFLILIFKGSFYTPFFKDVWEKKSEIEKAFHFHMEEPSSYRKINLSKLEYSKMNLPSNDG